MPMTWHKTKTDQVAFSIVFSIAVCARRDHSMLAAPAQDTVAGPAEAQAAGRAAWPKFDVGYHYTSKI